MYCFYIKMLMQCKVFALALVLNLKKSVIMLVHVVQAESGGWLELYLSRPSSTVIRQLGKK